jgi:hypothetical protein
MDLSFEDIDAGQRCVRRTVGLGAFEGTERTREEHFRAFFLQVPLEIYKGEDSGGVTKAGGLKLIF